MATTEPPSGTAPVGKEGEVLPLPKWLTRLYYLFPIVLYLPDMLFNFVRPVRLKLA